MRFSTVTGKGVSQPVLKRTLKERETRDAAALVAREKIVERRVAISNEFFESAGSEFPLVGQVSRALATGFGEAPPLVSALMRCELLTGVLMGVQDANAIVGTITLDCVDDDGESFQGMRGAMSCSAGEIVVRDSGGIVASMFQGPDRRTQVARRTTDALFYVFDVPGLGSGFEEAETCLEELLSGCSDHVWCIRAP
jgi:hypothetical protein